MKFVLWLMHSIYAMIHVKKIYKEIIFNQLMIVNNILQNKS